MIKARLRGLCRRGRHASDLPPAEHSRAVSRRESPFSPDWAPAFEQRSRGVGRGRYRTRHAPCHRPPAPYTELQALMEAMPNEEAADTGNLVLRDRLAEAVDSLPERERWIFEAHHYRQLSFRQIARELSVSKTTADRIYRDALALLRERLSD